MSISKDELENESGELLPGREALGKLKFSFSRTTHITRHSAHVHAHNVSTAFNQDSPYAVAQSEAAQSISIQQ
ncbi:hypothetical protein ACIHFE_15870 [Streptomyces sp. NPDC052396]|uniref:hypothetical protein n=1 Tax=Streptomyces sp. NPDC052396 TaxID=3365689 RepID=UPI0037D15241